ncbi:hypothetical protein HAX54_045542 [Datura stramonium]|uniref:Uncharacterized protein n=1 Tax=Datura stramonium TaxID=4076 RepID=A0ABS8WG17_DATST|nr:hypothetical protein [Datura stramonium]
MNQDNQESNFESRMNARALMEGWRRLARAEGSSASAYSTDMGVAHGKLDKSHVQEMHQRWQWRSWMNHGSFRGPRKYLVNPTVKHPFDVPKLLV